MKSGKGPENIDPDVELETLKQRFDIWKKYFKDQLLHTKINYSTEVGECRFYCRKGKE